MSYSSASSTACERTNDSRSLKRWSSHLQSGTSDEHCSSAHCIQPRPLAHELVQSIRRMGLLLQLTYSRNSLKACPGVCFHGDSKCHQGANHYQPSQPPEQQIPPGIVYCLSYSDFSALGRQSLLRHGTPTLPFVFPNQKCSQSS